MRPFACSVGENICFVASAYSARMGAPNTEELLAAIRRLPEKSAYA